MDIKLDTNVGQVIEVEGLCYQFLGFEEGIATHTEEQVGAVFDDCAECEGSSVGMMGSSDIDLDGSSIVPIESSSIESSAEDIEGISSTDISSSALGEEALGCPADCSTIDPQPTTITIAGLNGFTCDGGLTNGEYIITGEASCSWPAELFSLLIPEQVVQTGGLVCDAPNLGNPAVWRFTINSIGATWEAPISASPIGAPFTLITDGVCDPSPGATCVVA